MVNRERFMLDLDSEGFPIADHTPFAVHNIGKLPDIPLAQALLVDMKCLECEPAEKVIPAQDYTHIEQRIMGYDEYPSDVPVEVRKAVAEHFLHGITRLSDSSYPDAYFGWKR